MKPFISLNFGHEKELEAWQWLNQNHTDQLMDITLKLLNRNFRTRYGELDIVFEEVRKNQCTLVIVEVRARHQSSFALDPAETLGRKKITKLKRVARAYLAQYKGDADAIRFDLMTFFRRKWTHYRDVF